MTEPRRAGLHWPWRWLIGGLALMLISATVVAWLAWPRGTDPLSATAGQSAGSDPSAHSSGSTAPSGSASPSASAGPSASPAGPVVPGPGNTGTTGRSTSKCPLPAYPGPTCTGVPAGIALTTYTGPNPVTAANTVIDSKVINCNDFTVRAANVTIKNSKINCNVVLDGDNPSSSKWSLTIQDSEVAAGAVDLPAIGTANVTVLRSNVHGGHNGLQCDEKTVFCVMQDSWVHGQYQPQNVDSHLGGFLSDGGRNISLIHNFIVCDAPVNNVGGGCTGDINFIPNFSAISGALVQDNLLGANVDSSFCTYGGEKSSSPTPHSDHMVYKNNVFQRGKNGKCGAYGPVTGFNATGVGNQWINNRWDDGAVVVSDN